MLSGDWVGWGVHHWGLDESDKDLLSPTSGIGESNGKICSASDKGMGHPVSVLSVVVLGEAEV